MPSYTFTQRYRSSYGSGDQGDIQELSELDAENINRDSPGTLELVEAKARAVEKAPANRQVTNAENRHDRKPSDTIDKTTFKAVRG